MCSSSRGPGSEGGPARTVPDEKLRYAQVVKHHRNGHLVEVERKQVFGEDNGPESISISGAERCNLTIRQENSRLARRTLGFSKKRSRLGEHLDMFFAHYNLCRPHGSLGNLDEQGIKRKWTPLRELGITDRNWSTEELLAVLHYRTSS